MTIKASGSLSMQEIDAEFGLGTNLGAYRGVQWWLDNGTTGNFPIGQITFNDFYSKRVNSPFLGVSVVSAVMNTTAVNPYTITLPALQNNDVIVYFVRVVGNFFGGGLTRPNNSIPFFPTNPTISNGSGIAVRTFYEKLNASDSGTTRTFTALTSDSPLLRVDYMIIRSNGPYSTVTAQSAAYEPTSGNPASQLITATNGTTPAIVVIGFMGKSNQNNVNSGGTLFTNADAILNGGVSGGSFFTQLAYKVYNSNPQNLTWDAPDSGDGTLAGSGYLQFTLT